LVLDAEPQPASVLAHVRFSIEGIAELVGARLVEGERRKTILDGLPSWMDVKDKPVVVLQARQRFPNEKRVELVWGKGVESKTGIATREDQRLGFVVRRELSAYIHCKRTKPDADCVPLNKIGLYFTAPIAADLARQVTLTGPDGKARHPDEPE